MLIFGSIFSVRADDVDPEEPQTETEAETGEAAEDDPETPGEENPDELRKILFIGNSYTRYNDMPQLFKKICDNAGLKVEVKMIAIDSATLYELVSMQSVQNELKSGDYDIVIMQEQSDTVLNVLRYDPSATKEEPEEETADNDQESDEPDADADTRPAASDKVAEVLKAADTISVIKTAMRMAGEDTKFWLYETMSYNGEPGNQALFTRAYERAASETGAGVIPAGRDFWEYAAKYPNIKMFLDSQHPSLTGSEIVAQSILNTLWTELNAYASLSIKTPSLNLIATQMMPLDVRDASNGQLVFTSSNPDVAEVSEKGLVLAKAFGTADITVTNSAGASVHCSVNVSYRDVVKGIVSDAIYNTVAWGTNKGIISGFNGGEYFGTELSCTRGQFVVFLWRLAGRPVAEGTVSFSDVNEDMSIYDAIKWAVSKGIIKGYDDGTFRPEATVTRRHVAIMLWRWCGRPDPVKTDSVFTDMEPSDTSYKAVLWGEESGIMKGTNGKFNPDDDCQRCHIIIFLYRYAGKYINV